MQIGDARSVCANLSGYCIRKLRAQTQRVGIYIHAYLLMHILNAARVMDVEIIATV